MQKNAITIMTVTSTLMKNLLMKLVNVHTRLNLEHVKTL